MSNIWEIFNCVEFMAKFQSLTAWGLSLYSIYIMVIFACFWAYLLYALLTAPRQDLKAVFSRRTLSLTLGLAAFFLLFGRNDLSSAFSYEVQNLADASAAVDAKNLSILLHQNRIGALIFGAILYFSNIQGVKIVLCLFLGLFYAVWERIFREVLDLKPGTAALLTLLAAAAHLKLYYFFSVYSVFSLFFSALFLYRFLPLLKDDGQDRSFFRLLQPVCLILLASLFRQENIVLFFVYLAGALFLRKALLKKAVLCLAAGAVLYLPFLYSDWAHEENQVLRPEWDQGIARELYVYRGTRPEELLRKNHLLVNVALTIKQGSRFGRMSERDFLDAVKLTYLTPQPSFRNVWYNLKYRSALFLAATAAWAVFFFLGIPALRHSREDRKYLAVLSTYIAGLFLIYHLANLAITIGLSYNYLLPAYIAFCALVSRNVSDRSKGAA